MLQKDDYIAALQREGEVFLKATSQDLNAEVPTCPGWNVAKLVSHMGRVYHSVYEHVSRRATEVVPATEIPRPPEGEAALDWCQQALEKVTAALKDIAPDEQVWSWAGATNQNGAFYHRRMAHETLIHRWDAQNAVGEPQPLEPELAADNLDELLHAVLPFTLTNWEREMPAGSLHIHRTDGKGEWTLTADNNTIKVALEHTKADAAVRGPASDLALYMWERQEIDNLNIEVFGDRQIAEEWAALSR